MHLLQLHIGKLVDERALVVGCPGIVILVVLQQLLELVVVDVFILPWRIHALAQCRAELHGLANEWMGLQESVSSSSRDAQ